MKTFETAIRKALQSVDGGNPKLRERVYQSAREALTNSQAKQGTWGSDAASDQNRRLEELIEGIEAQYVAAEAPSPVRREPRPERRSAGIDAERVAPPPDPQAGQPRQPRQRRQEPVRKSKPRQPSKDVLRAERIEPGDIPAPVAEKREPRRRKKRAKVDADLLGAEPASPKRGAKTKRRRPVFSIILVISLLIAFVGIGILWSVYSGIFISQQERDTSVPNPPAKIEGGDFAGNPPTDGTFSGDWTQIFTPQNPEGVQRRGNARAALAETGAGPALQIVSPDGGGDSEVLFQLPASVMQSLAGRKSLVAITLRSSTDTPTQIYVKCQLAANNDCGRHRFDVTYEVGDVVFGIDLSKVPSTGDAGYLALNSDITGAGNGVDIFAIRIQPQN
ncbi:hypothetical protein [Hoeflea prorocentri]|uniref:Uncharacterized protein n=1 Tax=Hoeflea prorocentri TaxID=1922333 RepID=A0A9X3UL57_9HYPH|nr:hypothetical protein [Hoeflea prorocentri]MCY6382586.1 hypothetical protein [Hoeflea prorocentri]MDA5400386.1 hypothetical protein [Hoeflea prorocentri]